MSNRIINKDKIIPLLLIMVGVILTTDKFNIYGKKAEIIANLIVIVAEILMFYVFKKLRNKNIGLHKIYLVLAILFGALYIAAFPMSELPDEICDYLRALEISELRLNTKKHGKQAGNYYSKNVVEVVAINTYKDELEKKELKLDGKKTFINYSIKALYNFICYIPQSIGIGIGHLLNLPIVIQMLFGKIFNYSLFVLLICLSIKYIPYKKSLVLFVSLLPITMQEATSLSPDALTIGLSIFLISYVLKIRTDDKQVTNKQIFILLIITAVLALTKIVYLPLCFLVLLIPKKLYKSKKHYLICNCLIISIAVILNLLWLKYSSSYLVTIERSSSTKQLEYILTSPILYVLTILHTIDRSFISLVLQMVGKELGCFKVQISLLVIIPALVILIKLIIGDKSKKKLEFNNIGRVFITAIVLSIIGLIFTSLYIQWTPFKSSYIEGLQGRYFIPLLIPISCVFMLKNKENSINENLLMFILFQNIISIMYIIEVYM